MYLCKSDKQRECEIVSSGLAAYSNSHAVVGASYLDFDVVLCTNEHGVLDCERGVAVRNDARRLAGNCPDDITLL
jgi:hypothetical protein